MATTHHTPRALQLGRNVVTADDMNKGTITKIGRQYVYTKDGARMPIESYLDTWAVI